MTAEADCFTRQPSDKQGGEGACSRLSAKRSQRGRYAAQREQAPSPQGR